MNIQHRPPPRRLEVRQTKFITPNMLRVTFGGAGLSGFPTDQAGGYVKLMLPSEGRPAIRTYTIRQQREAEIDIDFALHGVENNNTGLATSWALSAKAGETIEVGGPGPAKPLPPGAEHYLIAGDMAALPAISVNLEQLSPNARGIAVIEIQSEEDRQTIAHPPGVALHWLINPHPGEASHLLAERVRELSQTEGNIYAWAAAEFSAMRALRQYLRCERGLKPDQLYISSYWKKGLTEEAHKSIKREDALLAGL